MEASPSPAPEHKSPKSVKIRVKYDELSAKYASQVLLNHSAEEIFFDFSSGVITDPASGESLLPVHTRIAMTPVAARRLLQALEQTLNQPRGTQAPVARSTSN